MVFRRQIKKASGFAMVEVIISLMVTTMLLVSFQALIVQMIKINKSGESSFLASVYLRELIEIAKDLEQSNWPEITKSECLNPWNATPESFGKKCFPSVAGTAWNLFSGTEPIKNEYNNELYNRWLAVQEVCRDGNFKIVTSTCPQIDASTTKIFAKISWKNSFGTTISSTLETYIYDY